MLAGIRYAGNGDRNRTYLGHLRRVFPERTPKELRTILKGYWRVHQRAFLGLFYSRRFTRDSIDRILVPADTSILDGSVSRGKGVLLLVPHFGDERMLHIILAIIGYRMHVISSRYEGAPGILRDARLGVSMRWHHVAFPDQPPGWLYEALRNGEVVQISPTAYGGPRGHWVNSFGVPVLASSTPVRLAASTGCSLLVAWNRALPGMRYEMGFEGFNPAGLDAGGTAELFESYRRLAARYPEQYSWMNLVIRHRETNTIARLGRIPSEERELEAEAVDGDWDPQNLSDPQLLSSISPGADSALDL